MNGENLPKGARRSEVPLVQKGEQGGGAAHKQWRGEEIGSAAVSHCGD